MKELTFEEIGLVSGGSSSTETCAKVTVKKCSFGRLACVEVEVEVCRKSEG